MENQLDPETVNLVKAIRQTESGGNFQAKGKSGEYGAYQFTEPTWNNYAKKHGVNVPLSQATPQQQNEVAYKQVKAWKDAGHNVGEIASMWNAGEGKPKAYLEDYKGTNKYGVSYDTPAYAKNVATTYQQIKGGQPQTNQTATPTTQPTKQTEPKEGTWDYISKLLTNPSTWGGLASQGLGYIAENAKPLLAGGIVAGSTALGARFGGVPGAVAGQTLGTTATNALGLTEEQKAQQSTGETIQAPTADTDALSKLQDLSMVQANNNSQKLANVQTRSYESTMTGRRDLQNPDVQSGIQTNAMFGFAPSIDQNGAQDYSEAIQKSKNTLGGLNKQVDNMLSTEDSQGSFTSAFNRAKEIAHARLPETEWESADKEIDKAISVYGTNAGGVDNASLNVFHKMKMETGRGKKWGLMDTTTKKEAYKALSTASREEIAKNTKNKELYNATMKMEQNLINGQKVMYKLNGKKAAKNESIMKTLAQEGGKAAALYIGDKIGGPVGAMIGYLMENHIANAVDKKYGRTIFESPAVRNAIRELKSTTPEAYNIVVQELKKQEVDLGDLMDIKKSYSLEETKKELLSKDKTYHLPELLEKKLKTTSGISPNKQKNNKSKKQGKSPSRKG